MEYTKEEVLERLNTQDLKFFNLLFLELQYRFNETPQLKLHYLTDMFCDGGEYEGVIEFKRLGLYIGVTGVYNSWDISDPITSVWEAVPVTKTVITYVRKNTVPTSN